MEIVIVGLNHRTAPVEVREKVSFTAEQAQRAAEELRARGILEETLVLSTCNRSEVYGVPPESSHEWRGHEHAVTRAQRMARLDLDAVEAEGGERAEAGQFRISLPF